MDELDKLQTFYPQTNISINTTVEPKLNFDYKLNLPAYVEIMKNDLEKKNEIIYDMKSNMVNMEIQQLESSLNMTYQLNLMN